MARWRADHLVELVEEAVEGQGKLAWAAAQYALLHDRPTGEDPVSRFERAVFRFKLGHVLFLLDEHGEDNIRRCLSLAEEALRQAEALWRGRGIPREIPNESFFSLIFELQSWMGHRYETLGLYERAEHAYSEASIVARNTSDRVAYTTRTAMVMAKLGKKQTAYEILMLARDEVSLVSDEDVRWLWEFAAADLRLALEGDPRDPDRPFELGAVESFSDIYQTMLQQGPSSVQQSERLRQAVEEYRRWLETMAEDEA